MTSHEFYLHVSLRPDYYHDHNQLDIVFISESTFEPIMTWKEI